MTYSAVDNLEVMELATKYNSALTARIATAIVFPDAVLDFGAGTGTFAKRLSARGISVQCLEPDGQLAETLRKAGLTCHTHSALFSDNSFSFIYSTNVLEHIPDDIGTLTEVRRLLRPSGRLVLFVPAFDMLSSAMDRKVGHLRRYTRSNISQKVTGVGLRVLQCTYFDSVGFFASLAFRLFGNQRGDLDAYKIIAYDRWMFPVSLQFDRLLSRVLGKNVFLIGERSD